MLYFILQTTSATEVPHRWRQVDAYCNLCILRQKTMSYVEGLFYALLHYTTSENVISQPVFYDNTATNRRAKKKLRSMPRSWRHNSLGSCPSTTPTTPILRSSPQHNVLQDTSFWFARSCALHLVLSPKGYTWVAQKLQAEGYTNIL